MKTKISNFADFACVLPIVQQIIGIPVVGYHLVRVINELFLEVFKKKYVKTSNAYYDERIYDYKIQKLNFFMIQKKDLQSTSTQHPQERVCSFNKKLYDIRNNCKDYTTLRYKINYFRSRKIDSIARLSELGFAVIRCLPVIGSCYSLYVYNTSNIYQPLIPEISCGRDD